MKEPISYDKATEGVYSKPPDVSEVPNEGRVLKLSWTEMRHGDKGRLGQRDTVSVPQRPQPWHNVYCENIFTCIYFTLSWYAELIKADKNEIQVYLQPAENNTKPENVAEQNVK